MPFVVNYEFTSVGQGWAEQFYHSATTIGAAIRQVRNLDMSNRMKVSPPTTVLRFASVRDVALNRSGIIVPFNLAGQGPATGPEVGDVTSTAAVYNLSASSSGARRKVFFRGLSDVYVKRNVSGTDTPDAILTQRLDNLVTDMSIANFAIRQLEPLTPTQYSPLFWAARSPLSSSWTRISFDPTIVNAIKSSRIGVLGTDPKLAPGMRGSYTVQNEGTITVNAVTWTFLDIKYKPPGTWAPWDPTLVTGLVLMPRARIRLLEYNYPIFDIFGFGYFWSRKTGKAINLHRGAARAVVRKAQ